MPDVCELEIKKKNKICKEFSDCFSFQCNFFQSIPIIVMNNYFWEIPTYVLIICQRYAILDGCFYWGLRKRTSQVTEWPLQVSWLSWEKPLKLLWSAEVKKKNKKSKPLRDTKDPCEQEIIIYNRPHRELRSDERNFGYLSVTDNME